MDNRKIFFYEVFNKNGIKKGSAYVKNIKKYLSKQKLYAMIQYGIELFFLYKKVRIVFRRFSQ